MAADGRVLTAGLLSVATAACAESDDAGDTLAPLPVSGPTPPPRRRDDVDPRRLRPPRRRSPRTVDDGRPDAGRRLGRRRVRRRRDRPGGRARRVPDDRVRSLLVPGPGTRSDRRRPHSPTEPIAYGWRMTRRSSTSRSSYARSCSPTTSRCSCSAATPRRRAAVGVRRRDRTWLSVESSYLDLPAATEDIASLTYSPDGQVVRIRFTHGCEDP